MRHLIILSLVFYSSAALSFSRGPYLPTNGELQVSHGEVVFQAGFGEDPDYDQTEWDDEAEELVYLVPGEVIIKMANGWFELAVFEYRCIAIDDGAYGALSCDSATYLPQNSQFFRSCEYEVRYGYYCE